MSGEVKFIRRTPKEIEIFGGNVYIDINGKNIGVLGTEDLTINLEPGIHKIKMYKSHTYDTFIGFAETEIDVKDNNVLLVKYAAPMIVTQPGNIIVSDYKSEQQINNIVSEREEKITKDYQTDEQRKKELEEKGRNGLIIFIIIMIIGGLIYGLWMIEIYSF